MKKILILLAFVLYSTTLNSYSACLLENLKQEKSCTGAAAPVNIGNKTETTEQQQSNREDLIKIYQIPTLSYPLSIKNGFPILNPAANCAFGMCQPR